MKKWALAVVALLLMAGATWAEEAPPAPARTTTVGGGVSNPWRSPYRTAMVTQHPGMAN